MKNNFTQRSKALTAISFYASIALCLLGCFWAALVVFLLFVYFSVRITQTAHGRLDYLTALSLSVITVNARLKPEKSMDFRIRLPINLLYPLSNLIPKEPVSQVSNIEIFTETSSINGPLNARVYWPAKVKNTQGGLPLIVYFHGGGFVLGSVAVFDNEARSLANACNGIVVSVDYRLAPRNPYPAAIEDGFEAVKWAFQNAESLGADKTKILVAGDSAGGAISAAVALKVVNERLPYPLAGQLLFYPVTDMSDTTYSSLTHFIEGYGMSQNQMEGFKQAYLGHVEDLKDPYISPLCANNHKGLAPALIITAGFDPLRDSGERYAEKLKLNGVPVSYIEYRGMMHGFMSIRYFKQRADAFNETGNFVQELFK